LEPKGGDVIRNEKSSPVFIKKEEPSESNDKEPQSLPQMQGIKSQMMQNTTKDNKFLLQNKANNNELGKHNNGPVSLPPWLSSAPQEHFTNNSNKTTIPAANNTTEKKSVRELAASLNKSQQSNF